MARKKIIDQATRDRNRERQRQCRARKKETKDAAVDESSEVVASNPNIDQRLENNVHISEEDRKQSESGCTEQNKPSRTKLKDMSEDQKREYDQEKQRRYRVRQKAKDNIKHSDEINVSENAANTESMNNETSDCVRSESNVAVISSEELLLSAANENNAFPETLLTPGKKKQRDMDKDELKTYKTQKRGELRCALEELALSRKRTPEKNQSTFPNKKQRTEAEEVLEIVESPSLTTHKNCKVRIGLVNLFNVETTAIVIPHYDDFNSSHLLKEMTFKFTALDQEKADEFIHFIEKESSRNKLRDYGAVAFNWNPDPRLRINRQLKRTTIHVSAPVSRNNKYTVVTEAHLRASYLSCLLEADKEKIDSIAIPLLGLGVCSERSATIAIQTIFAYMHAVKHTNFQLIYLVTPEVKVYNNIGKVFSYVREFDLNVWTTEDYLKFEQNVFDRVKTDHHFASIPGTDMVWRAFKVTHLRGEKDTDFLLMNEIHRKMVHQTGIEPIAFSIFKKKYSSQLNARSFIVNEAGPSISLSGFNNLLDIRFNMDYFCGSNQVLRKLWILSYYHMYFQGHSGDELIFDPTSIQFQTRKILFYQLQQLHSEVIRVWNHTMDHAPYKCSCKKENGHHENMMIFLTKMSHPDYFMENWILANRKFVLNYERDEHFVKKLPHYQANFIHRFGADTKLLSVSNERNLQNITDNAVSLWLHSKPELFEQQQRALLKTLEEMELNKAVAEETAPAMYDADQYDKNIEFGVEKKTRKLLIKKHNALQQAADATEEDERADAMKRAEHYSREFDINRYRLHFEADIEMERTLRNRFFRAKTGLAVNSNYRSYVDPDDSVQDGDDDFFVNPVFDEEHLWMIDNVDCTIDEYINRKLVELHYAAFNPPSPDATICQLYELSDNDLNLSYSSDTSPSIDEQYPDALIIGRQTVACPYCGALSFEGERSWSCCKNGAVWIPPLKRVPKEILPIFQKKYRNQLISTNAAFSMASIRYCRQTQAPRGIQSLKIKGLVSCHPSALRPRGETPAFANFIVLNCGNKGIAEARYKTVRSQNKKLKDIFSNIQTYMDEHNRLYDSYKSMAELEEHFRQDKELVEKHCIKFRIVPPNEINLKDYDDDGGLGSSDDEDEDENEGPSKRPKIRKLRAHKGVYAQPSRMGNGYITVAYTWDAESSVPIPRGMTIYPKNPKSFPQEPLSIYSDLCELMSYPLFYPDAIGGWALHKYTRLAPETVKPTFFDRVEAHLNELKMARENPMDYYELNDVGIRQAIEAIFNVRLVRKGQSCAQDKSMLLIKNVRDGEPGDDSHGPMDFIEDDPANFNDEQHEAFGELERGEEAPIDPDKVGQRRSVRMVERKGDILPKRKKTSEDIPMALDSPFATWNIPVNSDKEEEWDEEYPERGRHETHDEEYLDEEGLSDNNESESENVETENEYVHYEGAETDLFAGIETAGEDVEVAVGATDQGKNMNEEDFDVLFGDENNAEQNALGRKNDGKTVKNLGSRKHVSLAEYAKFIMQTRRGLPCRFQGKAATLGQLFLIDLACRIREMRMQALTVHRAEFPTALDRRSLVKVYNKMLEDNFEGKKRLGMLVTMPASYPGTSKYQRDLVMSAVTVSNTLGNPHLFITFTGNPEWPEISEECSALGCQWADIPDFVNRVFKRRFEIFLEDVVGVSKKSAAHNGKLVREPGMFGPVVWFNYSVEFQQRGMPHCHLLVCLENPIINSAQVDEIISAEVPAFPDDSDPLYEQKERYYNLVKKLMVHTPCKNDPNAYCNQNKQPHWKQCDKGFPKILTEHTILSDNQYPDYRRTSANAFKIQRGGITYLVDSRYVVAHNRELLMKHNCHINIEIVSSIKTMKYMFKYIHKGCDRVLLEATEQAGRGTYAPDSMTLDRNVFVPKNLDVAKIKQRQDEADRLMARAGVSLKENDKVALNECSYMMDLSAMTSCEAAWRISGFPMHGASHTVLRGYIHEEGRDVMYMNRGVSAAQAGEMLRKKSKGMMAAWFEANQNPETLPNGKKTTDLTLDEMISYYIFDIKQQKFRLRERDFSHRILGRIQAPQPRWLELTATRLLALNVRGPTSWEDLRTFRGVTYDTCLQAARARGLMDGDIEWELALTEIARIENPVECRRFFVSILVHCAPANPRQLWDHHWEDLVNRKKYWTQPQKVAHALRHIKFLLTRHGFELSDFELGDLYDEKNEPRINPLDDIDNPDIVKLKPKQHKHEGKALYQHLNEQQKLFVDRALELGRMKKKQKRMMFVDGPGGTGKTYCYKTIYHLLSGKHKKVICVSHTGIAACLLPNGCTAHRKFSLPLEVSDRMASNISLHSIEGIALAGVDCIIWDEICMTDNRIIGAVDRLFQMLKNQTIPFGGVLVIMGGDWRQILPIVEGVHGHGVIRYTLKHDAALWPLFEKFRLTQNKRAEQDSEFAGRILGIGDGTNYLSEKRKMVFIPEENIERRDDRALANWVFPDVDQPELTKYAALLTVDNKTALRLNEFILNRVNEEVHEFLSTDTADKDNGLAVDPAIFASETPSGLPPHRLRLKVGAQVVLLRNVSVEQGLCNGTRLTVKKFGDDIIHCAVNNPTENSPSNVYLHRMLLSPTGKGAKSCGFRRLQYPIRLAYAMTINKSQGQTLKRCGLVLHSQVFAHGQLYVAMSRVAQSTDFKLCHFKRKNNPLDDHYGNIGMLVRNIVYRDILRDEPIDDILESLAPPKENRSKDNESMKSVSTECSLSSSSGISSSIDATQDERQLTPSDLSAISDSLTSESPGFSNQSEKKTKNVVWEDDMETNGSFIETVQFSGQVNECDFEEETDQSDDSIRRETPKNEKPCSQRSHNSVADVYHDFKKRVVQRFPLLATDGPCLELENENKTQCFMNVIANMFFSCPGIIKNFRNCTDSSKPLALILGKIFRREIQSTAEWRRTLPQVYHTGQQDVTDVFELLIQALAEENSNLEHQFTERRYQRCIECDEEEEIQVPVFHNFASFTLPGVDFYEDAFNRQYNKTPKNKKCLNCGTNNAMENVRFAHDGKYLFVRVWQNGASFIHSSGLIVSMFGSEWILNGFTEYSSLTGGKSGHYQAWVRGSRLWHCVSDDRVQKTQKSVDLEGKSVSILVFEKV